MIVPISYLVLNIKELHNNNKGLKIYIKNFLYKTVKI